MPALHPPAKLLVTGANGFVGYWTVHLLLQAGYTVRATVRTPEKARILAAQIAARYPAKVSAGGAFESVVVPDITKEGAFDEYLVGIEGVVHTATPVTFDLDDPAEYIGPAVKGTLGILHSAAKHTSVKRIVITSSISAVADIVRPPSQTVVRTEDDWNDDSVEVVAKTGEAATGVDKYSTSKVKSERAAWKFYEENRHTLSYDLSVVAPAWIFGPLPDDPRSPADITSVSMQLAWTQMFSVPVPPEGFPSTIFNHVHVVDVAEMHMRVLNTEDAGGKRFLASAGVCSFQDWYDIASGLSGDPLPGLVKLHPPREGRLGEALPAHTIFSGRRAEDELGIIYKPLSETVGDVVKDFSGRGWLQHLEN